MKDKLRELLKHLKPSNLDKETLPVVVIVLVCAGILLFSDLGKGSTRVYDCRLAEISPDFPPKVRDECRKRRMEYQKNSNENAQGI